MAGRKWTQREAAAWWFAKQARLESAERDRKQAKQSTETPKDLAFDMGPTPGEARAWVRGFKAGREYQAEQEGKS